MLLSKGILTKNIFLIKLQHTKLKLVNPEDYKYFDCRNNLMLENDMR
jgi:hypothetical protein